MIKEQEKQDEEEVQKNRQKISDELAFNARAISNAADDFIEKLSAAHAAVQKTLEGLNNSAFQQEKTADKIRLESGVLSLIPEKVQNRLNSIIPAIAKEIDLIYSEKASELNQNFKVLQTKLADSLAEHGKKISDTTEQFASNLKREANDLAASKNRNFLKNTMILVLFSGAVSALTSYLVGTYFPKWVTITGAHEVSVSESRVDAYGTNVNIDQGSSINNPDFLRSKSKSQK